MRTLIQGKTEDPVLWWSSQNLSDGGSMWRHGRAWLHTRRNAVRIEWVILEKRAGIWIQCGDVGDDNLTVGISLFFVTLYLGVQRFPFVLRLPGVAWTGLHGSGEREIRVSIMDEGIYWRLWRYPYAGKSRDWRDRSFRPLDFILGRER